MAVQNTYIGRAFLSNVQTSLDHFILNSLHLESSFGELDLNLFILEKFF